MSSWNKANDEKIDACIRTLRNSGTEDNVIETVSRTIGINHSGGPSEGAIEELTDEVSILRDVVAALIVKLAPRIKTEDLEDILGGSE